MDRARFGTQPMHEITSTYRGSRSAFDIESYDHAYESLIPTKRIRRIVWSIYYKYLKPSDLILELNSGLGWDSLELASNGIYVTATDASAEMISLLRKRLAGTALHHFVSPVQLPLSRLRTLYGRQFDGVISSLGGLNCTNQLQQVATDLSMLVKPGGIVALVVMSKFSLWETLAFLFRGEWRKALRRRLPDGVLAKMNGDMVWVHYYLPDQLRKVFASHFEFVEQRGINIISPPPTYSKVYEFIGRLNYLLEYFDDHIPPDSPLHALGDHYVIVFRRRDNT
jgi:SAM-dependent methyltransferase